MFKNWGIIIALIVVVLFFIILIRMDECRMMEGFWRASESYLYDNGLVAQLIYIGEGDFWKQSRPGFIYMVSEKEEIVNDPVQFKISSFSLYPKLNKRMMKLKIEWDDGEDYEYFPSNQTMLFSPIENKIILYDENGEITAMLYKDPYIIDPTSEDEFDEK